MKKIILLLTISTLFYTSFGASGYSTFNPSASTPVVNGTDVFFKSGDKSEKISLANLSNLKVKEFEALSGQKLSLLEKVSFKIAQKKLKKSLKSNGNLDSAQLNEIMNSKAGSGGKSQIIALVLAIFVGGIGVHRFYLGYTWQGIVQLLTLGGCGIWSLIDLIRIATGSLQPKDSEYEKTL